MPPFLSHFGAVEPSIPFLRFLSRLISVSPGRLSFFNFSFTNVSCRQSQSYGPTSSRFFSSIDGGLHQASTDLRSFRSLQTSPSPTLVPLRHRYSKAFIMFTCLLFSLHLFLDGGLTAPTTSTFVGASGTSLAQFLSVSAP